MNIYLGTLSSIGTIATCFIPAEKISLKYKLAVVVALLIINLTFGLYTAIKQLNQSKNDLNQLQNKFDKLLKVNSDLQIKHKALSTQFDNKNIELDNLENKFESSISLISNINLMLHHFLIKPSKEEKDCIHEIIKYLNINHIKE